MNLSSWLNISSCARCSQYW